MNRALIYFFYDQDGVVDGYVRYYLQQLKPFVSKIVVVCNGKLNPEGRDLFNEFTNNLIVRENKGFDVWAYRAAIDSLGESIFTYDELILSNYTLMGPVFPLSEMFTSMEKKKELDFWGITKHFGAPYDLFNSNPYGYLPEHIQSSFIVFRNKLIKDSEFQKYWKNIPMIHSYAESVGKYESFFTKYFADQGFKWDVYVNNDAEKELSDYMLLTMPVYAMKKYRCPVFKRRSFYQDREYFLSNTAGEATVQLEKYIREETNYDINYVWENMLRTCHQNDLVETLALQYILPTDYEIPYSTGQSKVSLIMYIFYPDLLEDSLRYASSMPDGAPIIITTPLEGEVDRIRLEFSKLPNPIEIRITPNRGRDVSSLLIACKDIVKNADFICFYHDKKSKQVEPGSIGVSFFYKIVENTLASKAYVKNIIHTFENNPRLGMLSPWQPHHGRYNATLANEWGPNFENVKRIAADLRLNVPMDKNKPPVAPLGTVFWFRTVAMKKLIEKDWTYNDFPTEPNEQDKTILHAIERLYPFVVQDAGYYPAYVATEKFAAIEISMLYHYVRKFTGVCHDFNIWGPNHSLVYELHRRLWTVERKRKTKPYRDINELVSKNPSIKIRLWMKRYLPRGFYGIIVRTKRAIIGPRGIGYSYDENEWEKQLVKKNVGSYVESDNDFTSN